MEGKVVKCEGGRKPHGLTGVPGGQDGTQCHITEQLEELNASEALADHKVFVLTGNSAFEGSNSKGHSTRKELSNIVFCLYKAQRDGGFIHHALHISGKTMKATMVDGLSRGYHTKGMMAGDNPMSFLPFHLGADARLQGRVGKCWLPRQMLTIDKRLF